MFYGAGPVSVYGAEANCSFTRGNCKDSFPESRELKVKNCIRDINCVAVSSVFRNQRAVPKRLDP